MQTATVSKMRRWLTALVVAVAGAAWTWMVWRSGGSVWPLERPNFPLAVGATGVMAACIFGAVLAPGRLLRLALAGAAVAAGLVAFLGEGVIERLDFDDRRDGMERELADVVAGGECRSPCEIEARSPARIAFRFTGDERHWSGACYDADDVLPLVGKAYSSRPPLESERAGVERAMAMFHGQVRFAPAWGGHWYGCSTRP